MRLLLVDDEARVLEGLERVLSAREDWEVDTAGSGCEALAILDRHHFDVLVTDMRMPGMDGAELLAFARERHPELGRIVLSGQADDQASMRAARVAHQFLNKPCCPDVFMATVERAATFQRYIADERVRKCLGRVDRLPSVPRIYHALSMALDADRSADEISDIVRQDPALVAKLLHLVSSAFFLRSRPVSDVTTAVMRLGVRIVRGLTLTVEVFGRAKDNLPASISIERLQRRALRTAQVAQLLAPRPHAASAFTAGLLRDVGLLALAEIDPGSIDGESAHAEIGAYVLGIWGLPMAIVEAVANQDAPDRIGGKTMAVAAAVHIASCLVDGRTPDAELLARLGKTAELPAWTALAEKL